MTSWFNSTVVEAWAALGVGGEPVGSILVHLRFVQSKIKVSEVVEYVSVLPVAPPKRTALVLETRVIVCPKRGRGPSPKTFKFSIYLKNFPLS